MVYSRAFTFSSGYSLGVLPCAGLCLSGLRQFQVFWASGACAVSAGSYLFASIAPLPWRGAFSQLARVVKLGVPFWRLCLTVRCSGRLRRSLNSGVSPAETPLYLGPCFIHRHLFSQAFIRWVFCRVPGFALGRCAVFKSFWPLALAQQAPPAIILQASRRFRGAVLFHGLRSSSSWNFPFWRLGLTVQSSRPAFGGRLTFVR